MEFVDDKIIPTKKSVYDYIYYESGAEKSFATALESMQNIKYFIKLPIWFKVKTPVGDYNLGHTQKKRRHCLYDKRN